MTTYIIEKDGSVFRLSDDSQRWSIRVPVTLIPRAVRRFLPWNFHKGSQHGRFGARCENPIIVTYTPEGVMVTH